LDVERFIDRALSCEIDGIRLRYVSRQDLIAMRLAVGREKDRRRAAELQSLGP
jgi:predicted nucleotidyltransferase